MESKTTVFDFKTYFHQLSKPAIYYKGPGLSTQPLTDPVELAKYENFTLRILCGLDPNYDAGNPGETTFDYLQAIWNTMEPTTIYVDHGREGNVDRKIVFKTCIFPGLDEGVVGIRSPVANNRIVATNLNSEINVVETLNNNHFSVSIEPLRLMPDIFAADVDLIGYFGSKSRDFILMAMQITASLTNDFISVPGNYLVYGLSP